MICSAKNIRGEFVCGCERRNGMINEIDDITYSIKHAFIVYPNGYASKPKVCLLDAPLHQPDEIRKECCKHRNWDIMRKGKHKIK
jgi:hypothetical protein